MAQLQVASRKRCCLGQRCWLLVYWYIGGRALALHAGLKSRLQKTALQSNAPKLFTIHHSPFTIKILSTTYYPLPTKVFIAARSPKC